MFKLDVVFCTHNRADRSPDLVPALRAQDCSVSFEILAVNNNSKDNTLAILGNLATQPGAPLRFVTETAQGYSLHSRSLLHHDLTTLETPTLERDLCDSRLDRRHHRPGASVSCLSLWPSQRSCSQRCATCGFHHGIFGRIRLQPAGG